jgi:hypothetical protein
METVQLYSKTLHENIVSTKVCQCSIVDTKSYIREKFHWKFVSFCLRKERLDHYCKVWIVLLCIISCNLKILP